MIHLLDSTYNTSTSTTETADATKEIYKQETQVYLCKIMHHCTAALQYLGFCALWPDQINPLTKHILQKQLHAYGSEAGYIVSTIF